MKDNDNSSNGLVINNYNNNRLKNETNVIIDIENIFQGFNEEQKNQIKAEMLKLKNGNTTKEKFAAFLGSFGIGVLQNILAGLLTNQKGHSQT